MGVVGSSNQFSAILNNFSDNNVPQANREAFKKAIVVASSDSAGLTKEEVSVIAKQYLGKSKEDDASLSSLVGTKFVEVSGGISKSDNSLMTALGDVATRDSIVTPTEAKDTLKRASSSMTPEIRAKLETIAGGSGSFVISDKPVEVLGMRVMKTKVEKVEKTRENQQDSKNLNLNNVLIENSVGELSTESKTHSGNKTGESVFSIETKVSELPNSGVVGTEELSVNIPIREDQTPREALLGYITDLASERKCGVKSKISSEENNGSLVTTATADTTNADTMRNKTKEDYKTPIAELGGKSRDQLATEIFGSAAVPTNGKGFALSVEGVKDKVITDQGKKFIQQAKAFGLISDKEPLTPATLHKVCEAIGIDKKNEDNFNMGAQYITQFQEAVVKKAGDIIAPFNDAAGIFKEGQSGPASIDKDALNTFKDKYLKAPVDPAVDKFVKKIEEAVASGQSFPSGAIEEFQGAQKPKLENLFKELDTSKNPIAKHPILQALKGKIDPSILEKGQTHIIKASPNDLVAIVRQQTQVSSNIVVQNTDLKVVGNNIVGKITLGSVKAPN